MSQNFDKVLISTGAAKWKEIKKITKIKNYRKKAIMMHCVSSYPCEIKNINLPRIKSYKKFLVTLVIVDIISVLKMLLGQ